MKELSDLQIILNLYKQTEDKQHYPIIKQLRKDIELCFVNTTKKLSDKFLV